MLNIGFVINSMTVGGAERSIARLVNALDPEGFRSTVICLKQSGPAVEWIESADVPVIEIGKKQQRQDRAAVRRLVKTLVDYKIDLVHSHNWATLMESSCAVRRTQVKGHIHAERGTVLGVVDPTSWRMKVRGLFAGRAMRRCDAVVSNSRSVAKRIGERCRYPEESVKIIPNGIEPFRHVIDRSQINSWRVRLGIGVGDIVLGSVGRLVPVKGFELAIRALRSLKDKPVKYHLMLVGDGPERNSLAELAREIGVSENVHFVGHQEDVSRWLGILDVYINTSHSEGMSQSIVEAMSAGLPIVATDVGDSSVLLGDESKCGRLVPAGNVDKIAVAIESLAPFPSRQEAGHAARERQESLFSIATMARRYEDLYREVVKRRSMATAKITY